METETPLAKKKAMQEPKQPSTQAIECLMRIKVIVNNLQGDVTIILANQTTILADFSIIQYLLESNTASKASPVPLPPILTDDPLTWGVFTHALLFIIIVCFYLLFRLIH